MADGGLYERDFYAWTLAQAAELRRLRAARANLDLDLDNLAEEIESMGRSERDALRSCLMRVIERLLELQFSPASEPRQGWMYSLDEHRLRIPEILDDSPSLRPQMDELYDSAWRSARKLVSRALARDGVPSSTIPEACPYTLNEILEEDWYPAPPDTQRN